MRDAVRRPKSNYYQLEFTPNIEKKKSKWRLVVFEDLEAAKSCEKKNLERWVRATQTRPSVETSSGGLGQIVLLLY